MKLPSQEKGRLSTTLYNQAAQFDRTESERKRKAAEEELGKDLNPRTLQMTNLKNADQIPITSVMVKFNFC